MVEGQPGEVCSTKLAFVLRLETQEAQYLKYSKTMKTIAQLSCLVRMLCIFYKNNIGLHLKKFLLTEQIACVPLNFGALSSKITFVFTHHVKFFCKKRFNFLQILSKIIFLLSVCIKEATIKSLKES